MIDAVYTPFLAQTLTLTPAAVMWSAGAVIVGLVCGIALGAGYGWCMAPQWLKKEKAQTLKCLVEMLKSAEQLTVDVDLHHDSLNSVRTSVDGIRNINDVNIVQQELFDQIRVMVEANRRLESDLVITQYQLQKRAQELDDTRREARVDALSGLANRRAYEEALAYFYSAFRSKNKGFGLILADVDHFKRINDTYGHLAGDKVVQRLGEVLRSCVRGDDVVARIGGDEFAILIGGISESDCRLSGARIRSTIERINFQFADSEEATSITISMGLTVARPGDSQKAIVDRADRALYRSKELGRNLVHAWEGNETMVKVISVG